MNRSPTNISVSIQMATNAIAKKHFIQILPSYMFAAANIVTPIATHRFQADGNSQKMSQISNCHAIIAATPIRARIFLSFLSLKKYTEIKEKKINRKYCK